MVRCSVLGTSGHRVAVAAVTARDERSAPEEVVASAMVARMSFSVIKGQLINEVTRDPCSHDVCQHLKWSDMEVF